MEQPIIHNYSNIFILHWSLRTKIVNYAWTLSLSLLYVELNLGVSAAIIVTFMHLSILAFHRQSKIIYTDLYAPLYPCFP